ncbi:MAG: ribosomal protein small subunit ribosomal protein [Candidatus Parcubacteria bacterium]|jgi:small subunit ribosomal protein S9
MMTATKTTEKGERYIEAIGRRKTAIARVRITPATKTTYSVNGKDLEKYFTIKEQLLTAIEAIKTSKLAAQFKITVVLKGGGMNAQADAMRHGMARAFIEYDKQLRGLLKKGGLLKRDPRAKERRKFGLKKARKSPQWSKR